MIDIPSKGVINTHLADALRSLHQTLEIEKQADELIVFGIQVQLKRALNALIMNSIVHYGYTLTASFLEGSQCELNNENYWFVIANFYKTTKIEVN